MKNFITFATAAVAGAVLALAASPALARTDVEVNIGVPGVFVQPAPVYVQPRPVYVEPAPVYMRPPPVYVQPAPVYVQPQPVYVGRPEWRDHRWREHQWREHNYGQRDNDHDGIPNRFDRQPDNPYRH